MFEFEYPFAFLTLLIFLVAHKYCKAKEDTLILGGFWQEEREKENFVWIFKAFGIFFLVCSLASPINKKVFTPHKEPSHAIIFAIDVSSSMKYNMQGGRKIDIAKKVGTKFISKRKNDHIGIIAFGSFAYVLSPLTFDTRASMQVMEKLYLGISGSKTALIDGLFMSLRVLKNVQAKEKIIILVTDGFDKGSRVPKEPFLNALHNEKARVYTIGIGNPKEYNRAFLKALANEGRGKFYEANNIQSLENAYSKIDTLEKSSLQKNPIVEKTYYYQYPLFFALLSFMLYLFLTLKSRR